MSAVVDASAIVLLLLRLPGAEVVEREMGRDDLVAPAHLDAEVLSALARLSRQATIAPARAEQAIAALRRARVHRVPVPPLLDGAWALRHNVAAYDALYVTLAARLRCGLLTADRKLAGAPHLGVPVTVVAGSEGGAGAVR